MGRDWHKDMTMCSSLEGEQWINEGNQLEEYDRLNETGCRYIATFDREEEAEFTAEAREALPYWLQQYTEEKKRANVAEMAYEWLAGEYKAMREAHGAEKERADKAEAEAEKWRIEAFRKYPTPEAYDAACAALHKHRERADRAEERVEMLHEAFKMIYEYIPELTRKEYDFDYLYRAVCCSKE